MNTVDHESDQQLSRRARREAAAADHDAKVEQLVQTLCADAPEDTAKMRVAQIQRFAEWVQSRDDFASPDDVLAAYREHLLAGGEPESEIAGSMLFLELFLLSVEDIEAGKGAHAA